MAAGQQKKRLSASSVVGRNLQEQYRAKKKKRIESSHNVLSLRPHISLEWDDIKGSVVAEKGQIGITTRDMIAFMDCGTSSHMGLADVYSVHHEIFGLENLIGVLSYEVWETHLSESERELLVQFLPKGIDVDQVLQALFIGENFHFGNPFLHWGMSLCSGKVHPDAVVQAERFFRANKKAYYSELKKYHINSMVEKLGKWKNRWFSCKDPEADIVQKKWRKDANKGFSPEANESRLYEVEDNFAATADSSSEIAEATVSTANRETNLGRCGGKPPKRKGLGKHGTGSTKVTFERATVVSNSKKEKVPHKLCFDSGDVAKYMSYFKVSKKQHQQVKKIKQNGEGIQSKSLNQVLGDIKGFNVQPYDLFEEEQRNLFHENWSLLAKRDLPAAFAHHEERRIQRQQWRKSLEQELSSKHLIDKDADTLESSLQEQEFGETENHSFTDHSIQEDDESMSSSTRNSDFQPMERISSVNCHHELPMVPDLEATNQEILKQETTAPIISKYLNDMNPQADVIEQLATKATAKNVWSAVGMLDSYYHSPSMSHRYMSNGELSLCQPQPIKEQSPHLIDLETNTLNHEATESLLPLSCNEVGETALSIDSGGSLFGSYSNQDRNELLPNFLKGQEMLQSYSHDQTNDLNQLGLHFLPTNDSLQENSQFPRQFQEQEQRLFEQRQMREKEIYMHQMLQKKIYSNDRYLSHEHFPTVDIHGRVTESVCVGPFQSLTNGIVLDGQNCFSAGAHIQSGWPNLEISPPTSQGLGGGDGSNTNENLYSVLPQYNQFPSRHAYSFTSSDNSFPSRNFVGGGVTGNAGVFQHPSHQLNYLNEHEVSAMKVNNSSWVNMQHSNSDIHDRTGRSFLGPWKQ